MSGLQSGRILDSRDHDLSDRKELAGGWRSAGMGNKHLPAEDDHGQVVEGCSLEQDATEKTAG